MKKFLVCLFICSSMFTGICFANNALVSNQTFYLNSKVKKMSFANSISPANPNLVWSSSDETLAIVDQKGNVTPKEPGFVTITAKNNNEICANFNINIKQKVVIIIGSSQAARMNKYISSYSYPSTTYSVADGTLNFVHNAGSYIEFQTNDGWTQTLNIINKYNDKKQFVEFHVFFPLVGNDIRTYACSEINSSNKSIEAYVKNYNKVIQALKNNNINVQGYVVSMHPLKPGEATSSVVVTNTNKNSKKAGYRSNIKYHTFNKTIEEIINQKYSDNLNYVETFEQIMKVNNTGKAFTYKFAYTTTDGMNWDEKTTKKYVDILFKTVTELKTENGIPVTNITLNKKSGTISLNSNNKTTQLIATVTPSNATNQKVTWTSSNTKIATVNSKGLVTAKNPGKVTITAKTVNGNKTATFDLEVNKKVIIIIGASQVVRMKNHVTTYSTSENNYKTADQTLVYVCQGGTKMSYQTKSAWSHKEEKNKKYGWPKLEEKIKVYSDVKEYVELHIFFPLVGNTIYTFASSDIIPETLNGYAKAYNDSIKSLKNDGYTVEGYVVSMHPVKPGEAPKGGKVVSNSHKLADAVDYRSNKKYYLFNQVMEKIIKDKYTTNLTYIETFTKIMKVNNEGKPFTYLIDYHTEGDGVHWDKATTKVYVDMMLDEAKNL